MRTRGRAWVLAIIAALVTFANLRR